MKEHKLVTEQNSQEQKVKKKDSIYSFAKENLKHVRNLAEQKVGLLKKLKNKSHTTHLI